MSKVERSRSQLYDEVWLTPMTKLARKYGLSDVGLAKICRKHNIPRPPRGYWARKEHGQKPSQTRLPNPESNGMITMRDPDEVRVKSPKLRQEVENMVAQETSKEQQIEVADNLHGANRLVRSANATLQQAKTDEVGLIDPDGTGLEVKVSKKSLHRALLIIDAILKALESRGYGTEAGPTATILGVKVRFGISEQLSTIKEEPKVPDLEGQYEFSHSRFKENRVPSEKLSLHIHEGDNYYNCWTGGCRKTWRDTKRQKVEDCLNAFVAGMIEIAARKKEREAEQARIQEERRKEQEQKEAEQKRRAAIHQKAKQERARVDSLFKEADAWHYSEKLRAYIDAATRAHVAEHGEIAPDSEFSEWIKWAMQQADRKDPLHDSPPSILDEDDGIDQEPTRRWSW
jgi:hypothetical protein